MSELIRGGGVPADPHVLTKAIKYPVSRLGNKIGYRFSNVFR